MKKLQICLLLVFHISLWAGPILPNWAGDFWQTEKQKGEISQAMELFRQRDYNGCYQHLKKITETMPGLPPARFTMALFYLSMENNAQEARFSLESGVSESPDYPGIYILFGRIALMENRFSDAQLHYEKALSLAEKHQENQEYKNFLLKQCYIGIASVCEFRKDWTSARRYFSLALEIGQEDGELRQKLAQVFFLMGMEKESFQELQKAFLSNRSLATPEIAISHFHTMNGQSEKASKWIQAAIKQYPKDSKVIYQAALWYYRDGQIAQAQMLADQSDLSGWDNPNLKILRGLIAWRKREYSKAEKILHEVYHESPGSLVVGNYLALSLAEQPSERERNKGLQWALINSRLYPENAQAIATLGWVYYHIGNMPEAEQHLQRAMSMKDANGDTAYYLAQLFAKTNRIENAKRLLSMALQKRDNFSLRKEAQELLEQLSKK